MKQKKKQNILALGDYLKKINGNQATSTIGGVSSLIGSGINNLTLPETFNPNTQAGSNEELLSLYSQGANQIDNINVGKSTLSGVAQGAAAGATFGPWGAAIGGAVGGLSNLTTSLLGNNKIQDRNQQLQQEQASNLNMSRQALESKQFNNQMSTVFATGGELTNTFNNGGTHEQNPNGGIPQGVDNEGTPNLVEQGELKYKDYIFSDRLKVDNKNTFADMAKKYSKESKERPNDPISKKGLEVKMNALKGIQELMKGSDNNPNVNIGEDGLNLKGRIRTLEDTIIDTPIDDNTALKDLTKYSTPKTIPIWKQAKIFSQATETPYVYGNHYTVPKQSEPSDNLLTSLRYAPAVASGLATLSDTFGLTNRPDYTAAKRLGSMSIKPKTLGNYMGYTPFDKEYATNQLLSSAAGARTGLKESSAGNRAAYQASLMGLNYGTNKGVGELARQSQQENIQRKQQAMAYNQGIDQYNAGQEMQAQQINNQYRAQSAQLGEQARMQSNQARMANLNNFLQSLGDIGQEELYRNMIASNKSLLYGTDRSGKSSYKGNSNKCGGKLKLK